MVKTRNRFGHYVLTADRGMSLFNGVCYTKSYISGADIDETQWSQVPDGEVPVREEAALEDYRAALTEFGVTL